jgi:hypothetical protein
VEVIAAVEFALVTAEVAVVTAVVVVVLGVFVGAGFDIFAV